MKLIHSLFLLFMAGSLILAQEADSRKLIIRGDDMGSSHAANLACIDAYNEGIMTTVELMVPCPWFPEAVNLLQEHPGLDIGIHLVLTSEWENYKWRPVSCAPSLVDDAGYFFPMIWANDRFPPERALREQDWKIEEIEQEFRAQIELALDNLPYVSHLTCHMGCYNWDPRVEEVYFRLAIEYGLDIRLEEYGVEKLPLEHKGNDLESRVTNFMEALEKMEKGKTYLYVEHPALDVPEMNAIGHSGYYGVAADRDLVARVWTDPRVMQKIVDLDIELIGYKDLVE